MRRHKHNANYRPFSFSSCCQSALSPWAFPLYFLFFVCLSPLNARALSLMEILEFFKIFNPGDWQQLIHPPTPTPTPGVEKIVVYSELIDGQPSGKLEPWGVDFDPSWQRDFVIQVNEIPEGATILQIAYDSNVSNQPVGTFHPEDTSWFVWNSSEEGVDPKFDTAYTFVVYAIIKSETGSKLTQIGAAGPFAIAKDDSAPTPTPPLTPTPTATPTLKPTATSTPTPLPTATLTPSNTFTPAPASTPTPEPESQVHVTDTDDPADTKDIAGGADYDPPWQRELSVRWTPVEWYYIDYHIYVKLNDNQFVYLGRKNDAGSGMFTWTSDPAKREKYVSDAYGDGPPIGSRIAFRVYGIQSKNEILGETKPLEFLADETAPTPTNTPSPTWTPTKTPTRTPTPTATITPTPTPIDIEVRLSYYIGWDEKLNVNPGEGRIVEEGFPVSNVNVGLIPEYYSPAKIRNCTTENSLESLLIAGPVRVNEGKAYLQAPWDIGKISRKIRLLVYNGRNDDNVHLHISHVFDVASGIVEDTVIPAIFPMKTYWDIFEACYPNLNFNGENVKVPYRVLMGTPVIIVDGPAADSGYLPNGDEKNIAIDIITNQITQMTRGILNYKQSDIIFVDSFINMENKPKSYILFGWVDNEDTMGLVNSPPEVYPDKRYIVLETSASSNTIQKIMENFPDYLYEEAKEVAGLVQLAEIGSMFAAYKGWNGPTNNSSQRELLHTCTVFYEWSQDLFDAGIRGFTRFDNNGYLLSYGGGLFTEPDLNVSDDGIPRKILPQVNN